MLQPQIAARRVSGRRGDAAAGVIPGQATKLRHVVANLIGNAIRFVPAGDGAVGVSATRRGRVGGAVVRDNGVGIPAEYHEGDLRDVPAGA